MTQRTGNEVRKEIVKIKPEEEVSFYYGNGNFCSLNCYNDWADHFMDRAIDNVSGRLHEPMTMSEENAWRKKRRYHWGMVLAMVILSLIIGTMRVLGKIGIWSEEDFNNSNLQNPN